MWRLLILMSFGFNLGGLAFLSSCGPISKDFSETSGAAGAIDIGSVRSYSQALQFATAKNYYNPTMDLSKALSGHQVFYESNVPNEYLAVREQGSVQSNGLFSWNQSLTTGAGGTGQYSELLAPPNEWDIFQWTDLGADIALNQGKYFSRVNADTSPLYDLVGVQELSGKDALGNDGANYDKVFVVTQHVQEDAAGLYANQEAQVVSYFAAGRLLAIKMHMHYDQAGQWGPKGGNWETVSYVMVQ